MCTFCLFTLGAYNNPVRLAGGRNSTSGLVEISYNGVWGTICNKGWTSVDADVVCRELGFYYALAYSEHGFSIFPRGTGKVYIIKPSIVSVIKENPVAEYWGVRPHPPNNLDSNIRT